MVACISIQECIVLLKSVNVKKLKNIAKPTSHHKTYTRYMTSKESIGLMKSRSCIVLLAPSPNHRIITSYVFKTTAYMSVIPVEIYPLITVFCSRNFAVPYSLQVDGLEGYELLLLGCQWTTQLFSFISFIVFTSWVIEEFIKDVYKYPDFEMQCHAFRSSDGK